MDTQVVAILSALTLAMPMAWAQDLTSLEGEVKGSGEPIADTGSRTLIGEEKTKWIESMRSKLPIARRQVGPFGFPQDPDAEIAKPQKIKVAKGAFLEAVAEIKVNAVMPADDKFTIGSREFVVGDKLPLIKNQRQFNIEIVSVKAESIVFKDVDTGKLIKKNLFTLPAGMKKSTSLVAVRGIFPANKKNASPLNLDDEPLPISSE